MPIRKPGERAGLTRDAVIRAALSNLLDDGSESLSIRCVARRLGVAPNAIYSHVSDKNALLDAVLDHLLGNVDIEGLDALSPERAIEQVMVSTFDVLVVNPTIVLFRLSQHGSRGPNAVRLCEVLLSRLLELGLPAARAEEVLQVLIVHAIGSAAVASPQAQTHVPTDTIEPSSEVTRVQFIIGLRWLIAGATGR